MSRLITSFVLGFHGCSREVANQAIRGETTLLKSDKKYDWLGPGVYFWESDPVRALEWAEGKAADGVYAEAAVVGAVIDLGNCLDLLVRENLDLLGWAYENLAARRDKGELELPVNKDTEEDVHGDKLLRFLDRAVIKNLHEIIADQPAGGYPDIGEYLDPFDSVRGLFTEGGEVYPGSGFYERTHTQIAVLSDECIKGYFLPRGL